jgi:polar amino acid transport system substrate-binding protein
MSLLAVLAASAILAALPGLPAQAASGEPGVMLIHHVPLPGGGPDGVPNLPTAGRTATWAHQAGLPLRWEAVPFKRSLQELQRNGEPFCVLGVFDTPERRRFARYSLPIHREEPQVFLAASRVAAALRQLPSAQAALQDRRFKLLVYDGVAYGGSLDAWIAQLDPPPLKASAGAAKLAAMLARGHADFTISVAAELQELRSRGEPGAQNIEVVALPGMPRPPLRYLACSLRVPLAWLARFNAAVRAAPAQ